MKIIVDIDDTLIDLLTPWLKALNKKYKTNLHVDDIIDWDMHCVLPNLSYKEICAPLDKKTFWKNITPINAADFYLRELIKDGHEIFLCTSTHFNNVKFKYEIVIKKYFPFIKWKNVIVTGDKSVILGDVIVDDNINNIEKSICKHRLLVDAPYNKKFNYDDRVYSWKNIYERIKEISDGEEY